MPQIKFLTLARHIVEEERKYPEATGELSNLLHDLSLAAKVISLEVNKAGLVDIIGFTGDNNIHSIATVGVQGRCGPSGLNHFRTSTREGWY